MTPRFRVSRPKWEAEQRLHALRGTLPDANTYLRDLRSGVPGEWISADHPLLTRALISGAELDHHLDLIEEIALLDPAPINNFTVNWRGERGVTLPRPLHERELLCLALGAQLTEVFSRLAAALNADPTSEHLLEQTAKLGDLLAYVEYIWGDKTGFTSLTFAFNHAWRGELPGRIRAASETLLGRELSGDDLNTWQLMWVKTSCLLRRDWPTRAGINGALGSRDHPLRELARAASARVGCRELLNMTATLQPDWNVPDQGRRVLGAVIAGYFGRRHEALLEAMRGAQPAIPPRPRHIGPLDWALRHTWLPVSPRPLNGELDATLTFCVLESCLERDPEVAWQLPRLKPNDPDTPLFGAAQEHYPQLRRWWYVENS